MRLAFFKVNKNKKEFKETFDKITFSGFLYKKDKLVKLEAIISGEVDLNCCRCGNEYVKLVDEKIDLLLSNTEIDHHSLGNFDIIEVGEYIDLQDILNSEIESIKLDLNYCKDCKDLDEVEYKI